MTPRATTELKRCPMYDDNCLDRVAGHIANLRPQPFSKEQAVDQILLRCGRYSRGKHVGKVRGWAEIEIVTKGGWKHNEGGYGGFVAMPGRILRVSITDFNGKTYLEA